MNLHLSSHLMIGLIARKAGMSRVFLPTGEAVVVTYLEATDNTVMRTRTKEKDGYNAILLGFEPKERKTHKGTKLTKTAAQKEFTVDSLEGFAPGGKVSVSVLPEGSFVTVTGVSKGKGFQGVMKRFHFAGGPRSHGSHFKREPGSVGMRTWPGRIHAGKKLPGRMGGDTITIKNRPVIVSDATKNIIAIKGPVPGPDGAMLYVTLEPTKAKAATPSKK